MNWALFKYNIKRHWKFVLGFNLLIIFYLSVIIDMIDPDNMLKIQELFATMGQMMDAFGISIEAMTNPLAYTASVFFGSLLFMFVIAYVLLLIIPLFIKPISDTSIAYILTQPMSRKSYIITQIVFMILTIILLFLGILLTSIIMLSTKGSYDFFALLNLVTIMFLLNLSISMVAALVAIALSHSRKGTAITVTLPVALLFLLIIGNILKDKTNIIMYLSPFGWINPVMVANNDSTIWPFYIIFVAISIISFCISIKTFKDKDLAI